MGGGISCIIYVCAAFFNKRTMRNYAVYIGFIFAVLCTISYNNFLEYFTTDVDRGFMTAEWFRHLEFMLEMILMLAVPILLRFGIGHKFNVKDKSEWAHFFGILPFVVLTVIPIMVPQSLFGYTDFVMKKFALPHFMWMLGIIALIIGIYFVFRKKDNETKLLVCVFLSLYLLYHYNSCYLMGLNLKRMPLQLCNLGSYLVLIMLIIKKQSFFDFVLLANVPGAIIAICVPDINSGIFGFWNVHFIIEHTWVFAIPILSVLFGLFKRPGKGAIKHFMIGFTIYFVSCAIVGTLFNCFLYVPGDSFLNEANYFYMFDTMVLDFLPFLSFTREWAVTLSDYTFYPLYMAVIYVLFSIFALVIYWVFKGICKLIDKKGKKNNINLEDNTLEPKEV